MRNILYFLSIGCLCYPFSVKGQLSTSASTQLTTSAGTTMAVRGSINNRGSIDIRGSIHLDGANQTLQTTVPIVIGGLALTSTGNKTVQGQWTVSGEMLFENGVLIAGGTAKLLYTGDNLLSGTNTSYVDGIFYQQGTGTRFFPVGTGSVYAPMSFASPGADVELGVEVIAGATSLSLPLDVKEVASNRYWQVHSTGEFSSPVSLYFAGTSVETAQPLVVIQADNLSGTALNLGGGVIGDFVGSFSAASKPILTVGVGEKVNLQIMDLITPFNVDTFNDKLRIVNIEYTFENKVTLLDRWGVTVKTWSNFRNYDDPSNPSQDGFDFTRLSPGNYVCVLEYRLTQDSPREKLTQMITVLKGK